MSKHFSCQVLSVDIKAGRVIARLMSDLFWCKN